MERSLGNAPLSNGGGFSCGGDGRGRLSGQMNGAQVYSQQSLHDSPQRAKQVFISHAGNGSMKMLFALPLGKYLDALGVSNFVDHRHLEPTVAADEEIKFQLKNAPVFVALIDEYYYLQSGWCMHELNCAINRPDCAVFPVFLSDIKDIRKKGILGQEEILKTVARITGWEVIKHKEFVVEMLAVSIAHKFRHGEFLNSSKFASESTAGTLKDELYSRISTDIALPMLRSARQIQRDRAAEYLEGTRAWLFVMLDQWCKNSSKQVFALTACSGVGKSVCVARWINQSQFGIGGFYFFQREDMRRSSIQNAISCLSSQLRTSITGFALLKEPTQEEIVQSDPLTLFNWLIAEPAKASHKNHYENRSKDPVVVVIDALDECSDPSTFLKDVVFMWQEKLPSWLKLVVTTRNDRSTVTKLKKKWWVQVEEIDQNYHSHQKDLECYAASILKDKVEPSGALDAAVRIFVQRSQGLFVYLSVLKDHIDHLERECTGKFFLDINDIRQFPHKLEDVYEKYFGRFKNDLSEDDDKIQHSIYQTTLGSIVAARIPLPVDVLEKLLEKRCGGATDKINGIVKSAQKLCQKLTANCNGLKLVHQTMLEYLVDNESDRGLKVDEKCAHEELGNWCFENQSHEYALHHMLYHLDKAGLKDKVQEVLTVDSWFSKIKDLPFGVKETLFQVVEKHIGEHTCDHLSKENKLKTRTVLYQVLEIQGKYKDAVQVCEGVLKCFQGDLASSMNHLGTVLYQVLQNQGKFQDAVQACKGVLKCFQGGNGDDKVHKAHWLANLATSMSHLEEYKQAETNLLEAINIFNKCFGPEDTNVINCRKQLASILHAQGDLDGAASIYRQVLAVEEKKYDGDNRPQPEVAITLNNLALVLREQKNLVESEEMLRKVLKFGKEHYGETHPKVAITLNNLGVLLGNQEKFGESEAMLREALTFGMEYYGDKHPRVAETLNNLALILSEQEGKLDEAIQKHEQVLAIEVKLYGEEAEDVLERQRTLSSLRMKRAGKRKIDAVYGISNARRSTLSVPTGLRKSVLQSRFIKPKEGVKKKRKSGR